MAGRTLGEAWVTIMPDTAKFRAALQAQVKKDMAGFKPAVTVTVNLKSDSAKLRSELQTAVTAASKGLSATATVKTNLDNTSITKTKAELAAATKDSKVTVKGIVDPALIARVDKFRDSLINMIVTTNDKQAEAQISLLDARANALAVRLGGIKTDVGVAGALVQMAALDAAAAKFKSTMAAKSATPGLGLELTLANSQFTHLEQNAHSLKKEIESALTPSSITIGTVTDKAKKDLEGLAGGADAVLKEISKIKMSGGVVTADDIAKVKTLTTGLGQLSAAVAADGVTLRSTSGAYRGWVNTLISVSRAQIPLFNGALEKMLPHFLAVASGAHILVEAALEIVAVWVPAAMALTIFGVAATKASLEVASDVRNMGIAASGTGQQFQGMAKKIGTSMSDIAKPYVFTAYGLALIGLQKQSKTTATVIQTVGGTIDRWVAEAVLAYQKGTGKMALQGASMFGILGDSFKQVGTIINGFMKITPGYAKDLLMLGDGILHIASAVLNSGFAQGFGKIFLALHGAIFYLGLFATLGTKLGTVLLSPLARITGLTRALGVLGITSDGTKGKLAKMMDSIVLGWQSGTGKAIKAVDDMGFPLQAAMSSSVNKATKGAEGGFRDFKTVAGDAMTGLGGTIKTAAKGIKGALGGMLASLGINPWLLGIAAIGAAIFGLVMLFKGSTSAAQAFSAAASNALTNSDLQSFGTNMQLQLKAAQGGLAGAKAALRDYVMNVSPATKGTHDYAQALNRLQNSRAGGFISSMTGKVQDWKNAINGLNQQNHQFNSNLNLIAKTSGVDLPTALTMATHAGITTKQMMSDTGVAAQEDALQVEGLIRAYSSLVNGVGGVNTAYQAMNIQSSQTMKNAQNVAGAFANYTTLVTGGANAFDTFIQGQATLATNLGATGAAGGKANLSLGKLKNTISLTGANLDKLTPASVTANQAFLQQVNNAQALYGSLLQLAAAAGNTKVAQHNLGAAGKDMIATLLKTAGGSKAARIQIYALAQTFGYTGKNTLPALVKWLGATGDRTKDLQVRMNGLTAGAGNMARAAKALSGELNGQLRAALSKSIIDAEGGQAAFDKFAGAIRTFAAKSSSANMEAVIKQGNNLKKVFIASAGSAAAAEPVLQNYFQTLGVHNQAQAKAMADQILGIGSAANKISKPLSTSQNQFKDWASKVKISSGDAVDLWKKLNANSFDPLSGKVSANKQKFLDWAHQMGINKSKASDLWSELLNNKLATVNSQVDGNKAKFFNLMKQMGETKGATQDLWDTLQKAPHVKATVAVGATTTGQVQAVAQASGATKQVIGRMFFSANAHGMATGGKVPGWHNTGDNTLASSPGGPIMLQGGEAIVPKNLSTHPEFTNFAKKKGIPGFASGGLVGTDALGNIGDSYKNWRTNTANSSINFAGDAMKANVDGAYDALASAFTGVGGSAKGQAILAAAEKWNHHKYVFGGPSNPSTGWDCSSFAGYILGHDFHLPLPGGVPWSPGSHGPVSGAYAKEAGFSHVGNSENQIQAGDLLVFGSFSGPTGHVGFGVGPGQMFSAYSTASGTIFSSATDAGKPPNIYRYGGGGAAAGGKVSGIKTGVPLIDKMASDAQSVYAQSAAIKALFPKLGPAGGQPGTATAGSMVQNGKAIFDYLRTGLGMNPIAAAGAIASIWGESLFNPEAQGSGGRGLIGWTPPSKLPNSAFTGNATADLDNQLPLIVKFVRDNNDLGVINAMNSAGSIAGAANLWGRGVERFGKNDVHSEGLALATQIMNLGGVATSQAQKTVLAHTAKRHSAGGKIPGFARGGRVLNREIARLQKTHDRDAGKYHHFEGLAAEMAREEHAKHITQPHLKSLKGRENRYLAEAAKYAGRIHAIDNQLTIDNSAKLGIPKPANQVMRLAEKLAVPPLINKYTAGSGSISPLGWALQPILGDLMIAQRMAPKSWAGKPVINNQASSVMANWVAAVDTIGGFLNSQSGLKAAQLAGRATGIHGRQTEGPRKSFLTGGTIRENVMGVGPSGDTYKFHAGDKVTGPAIAATQGSQNGLTQEDRMLLIALVNETKKGNQIAANQGREYARAINQNVARRIPR